MPAIFRLFIKRSNNFFLTLSGRVCD